MGTILEVEAEVQWLGELNQSQVWGPIAGLISWAALGRGGLTKSQRPVPLYLESLE